MNKIFNRRDFVKFLGSSAVLSTQYAALFNLLSCNDKYQFNGIDPIQSDNLELAKGLNYNLLVKRGDSLGAGLSWGANNDYLQIFPLSKDRMILWANHEYFNPLFVTSKERTKKNVDIERTLVGGSLVEIHFENNKWDIVKNSKWNKKVDGTTKIPFANGVSLKGSSFATGTMGNCAGGKTPWNTFLTCEENYHMYYGERQDDGSISKSYYSWQTFYKNPPEHYGWVVEVHPITGKATKHTSLGRCAHECATCVLDKNGHTIVYTGDDKNDECLYKFVASKPDTLDEGELFVANIEKGEWVSLDRNKHDTLQKEFKNQLEIQTYLRKAADLVGGSKLNRPEDIEIDPITGDVFITFTNNKKRGDFHGHILKISETDDYNSTKFKSEVFKAGGEENGFSCPDNLAFDQNGNLWICTDISGSAMNKPPYSKLKNNGLFVVPRVGPQAGEVIQLASAPMDAELTGLCFSPDHKQLFLSVQHPGERSKSLDELTSHWPEGSGKIPKSSVVVIDGPLLEALAPKWKV